MGWIALRPEILQSVHGGGEQHVEYLEILVRLRLGGECRQSHREVILRLRYHFGPRYRRQIQSDPVEEWYRDRYLRRG